MNQTFELCKRLYELKPGWDGNGETLCPGRQRAPQPAGERDFAAEAKQIEEIMNRPHQPDYQCTQCAKSPAEHVAQPQPLPGEVEIQADEWKWRHCDPKLKCENCDTCQKNVREYFARHQLGPSGNVA